MIKALFNAAFMAENDNFLSNPGWAVPGRDAADGSSSPNPRQSSSEVNIVSTLDDEEEEPFEEKLDCLSKGRESEECELGREEEGDGGGRPIVVETEGLTDIETPALEVTGVEVDCLKELALGTR